MTRNTSCWIIGRKATLVANGHEYPAQPYIVFETEEEAIAACDMIERVSGERPMIVEGALYRTRTSDKAPK